MTTIKDVARHANVSFTTVSHVINQTRPVAAETAARVRQAIEELGYFPSDVARALKLNRTRTVGMIVTSTTNPFFAEVTLGVERTCFERGYSLMLCNTEDIAERLEAYLATLFSKRIEALVVMTSNASPAFLDSLGRIERIPVIAIDAAPGAAPTVVNDDSRLGGEIGARFLIEAGHRRIACLCGPEGHPRMRERLDGLDAALETAVREGRKVKVSYHHAPLTIEGGRSTTRALLAGPDRPDAIFCFNDLMAIGALRAAREAGLALPDDLSVIGYDDIEFARHVSPALTTIRQPALDIGACAATVLIDHLENNVPLPQVLTLAPALEVRESTRSAAAG